MASHVLHIILAFVSWTVVLPIGIFKSYHQSRGHAFFEAGFHILNLSTILTAYLGTSDGSLPTSHKLYGWLATLLPIACSVIEMARRSWIAGSRASFRKLSLPSLRSLPLPKKNTASLPSGHHETGKPLLHKRERSPDERPEDELQASADWQDSVKVFFRIFAASCILFFGHLTLMSGMFNLLASMDARLVVRHWAHIRYGVLLMWYSVFTFFRWADCISTLQWSWDHFPYKTTRISAEMTESVYFVVMGCFCMIEKLYSSNNRLVTIRHAPIEVAAILCGLCGISVERIAFANKTRMLSFPVSALVYVVLGLGLSAHPYEDTFTTEIHGYFPMFLLGFSVLRIITLLVMQIKAKEGAPPLPYRPLTELMGVFCLLSGGLMIQAATPEIIDILKDADLSAATTAAYAMCMAIGILICFFILLGLYQKRSSRGMGHSTVDAARKLNEVVPEYVSEYA